MTEISSNTLKLLALSMLKGIGPKALKKISLLEGFEITPADEIADKFSSIPALLDNKSAWRAALDDAQRQVDEATKINACILSALDPDYPKLLAATKDDPFIIWVRGKLHSQPGKSVAVIGTREPTAHGEIIAERIANFFVENSWSIVSGLAIGCDAIAHKAALKAGGHTVAVLAHGLHTVSPARHKKLAIEIVEAGGALVSEYRVGQDARPQQFVKRDRTQAGMAQGVVMIQSDLKGGSLHASRAALDYERWLAVPYPTDQDRVNIEPKTQANLLLSDGELQEQVSLMRCTTDALERIQILRSREDYPKLLNMDEVSPSSTPPAQGSLLS